MGFELSKREVASLATGLALGGVLLSGCTTIEAGNAVPSGPNASNTMTAPAPSAEPQKTADIQCMPVRLDRWNKVKDNVPPEQIAMAARGLKTATEQVESGRFGIASCDRDLTEQEKIVGVRADVMGVDEACYLVDKTSEVKTDHAAVVICVIIPWEATIQETTKPRSF